GGRAGGVCSVGGYEVKGGNGMQAGGRVWQGGGENEEELLAAAYRNACLLAEAKGLRSIAFPAISTGVYGFPADRAAFIAVATLIAELRGKPQFSRVILCCFGKASAAHHHAALRALRR